MSRIQQSGRSSLRRPKLPTKGGSAPKEEEGTWTDTGSNLDFCNKKPAYIRLKRDLGCHLLPVQHQTVRGNT